MSTEVLQWIARRSRPVSARDPWGFLSPKDDLCKLPFTDPQVLAELREQFGEERLEAARVLVPRDGAFALNPVLAASVGLFVGRPRQEAPPPDVVSHAGALMTDDPPVFPVGRNLFANRAAKGPQFILLACSDADLIVYRLLGLPCAPAAGLDAVTADQLRRLLGGLPLPGGASDPDAPGRPTIVPPNYRLVLPAWQIADLDPQPSSMARAIAKRLLMAEEAYEQDLSTQAAVWRPMEDEVRTIGAAAGFQDRALARQLILQSISNFKFSLAEFQEDVIDAEADYGTVRRQLRTTLAEARETGLYAPAVKKKLAAFRQSFDSNIVEDLIQGAMAAAPRDRPLLLLAADLLDHWHRSSHLVQFTEHVLDYRHLPEETPLRPEQLTEYLRLVDGLVKIHRALTRSS